MSIKQISVFLQSKPGHLQRILDDFVSASVNVRGFSASDTGDYGIVRFVVDDVDRGLDVLKEEGHAAVLSDVLALKLEDTPGELARVMRILARCGINVVYSYSLISTFIVMSVEDLERAEQLLADEPVELLTQSDLA